MNPGHTLIKAHERKMMRYGEACRGTGIWDGVQATAVGHMGEWAENTVGEVKRIGSALARQTGGEEGEVIRHLVQRISVALVKLNTTMLLNRRPDEHSS